MDEDARKKRDNLQRQSFLTMPEPQVYTWDDKEGYVPKDATRSEPDVQSALDKWDKDRILGLQAISEQERLNQERKLSNGPQGPVDELGLFATVDASIFDARLKAKLAAAQALTTIKEAETVADQGQPTPAFVDGTWGIVEIMGHRQETGQLSVVNVGWNTMVRVSVPRVGDRAAYTLDLGVNSIFSIFYISKTMALERLEKYCPDPLAVYDIDRTIAVNRKFAREEY
jgi:hypothetical protein